MGAIAVKSALELISILLLLYGIYKEDKLIAWEQKEKRKIIRLYHILKKRGNK